MKEKALCGDIDVWFNKSSIANVLSYSLLSEKYRVVGDSACHESIFANKFNKG